jgi:hypothetical protein
MIEILGALFKTKTVRSPSGESSQPKSLAQASGVTHGSSADKRLAAIYSLVNTAIRIQHNTHMLGALAARVDLSYLLERIRQLSAPSMTARRR